MKKFISVSLPKRTSLTLALFITLSACTSTLLPEQTQITPSYTLEAAATKSLPPTETQLPLERGVRAIHFSGYEWLVRDQGSNLSGPGPNVWDGSNVWVDESGDLHLKLTHVKDGWHSAEVTMTQSQGFGRYQFQVIGPIDQFDPNVVLGLFNYPTEGIGPDGTNEIDIEFAHWGNPDVPIGNFTVWPSQAGIEQTSNSFPVKLNGTYTTQRFIWQSQQIFFQSLHGHTNSNENEFAKWLYQPSEPINHIPQHPIPIHINLWLFQGQPPIDGNEVEVIIHSFSFTSME
ncbi:MAG: glycoside hydrolase family 16 protein [Anaerolineales bacterium]